MWLLGEPSSWRAHCSQGGEHSPSPHTPAEPCTALLRSSATTSQRPRLQTPPHWGRASGYEFEGNNLGSSPGLESQSHWNLSSYWSSGKSLRVLTVKWEGGRWLPLSGLPWGHVQSWIHRLRAGAAPGVSHCLSLLCRGQGLPSCPLLSPTYPGSHFPPVPTRAFVPRYPRPSFAIFH